MERYAPIHPDRPIARTAIAVAISLGVHVALVVLLVAWSIAAAVAARLAEARQPKEVSLTTIDAERWEANRRVTQRPERPSAVERLLLDTKTKELPAQGTPGRPAEAPKLAKATPGTRPTGWATAEGLEAPAPAPGPSAPPPVGPTLDVRPQGPARPARMTFTPVGEGGLPQGEGTTFMNLTVTHPEAWRFTVFFNRSVEHMDSVWRYELGAPVPDRLWEDIKARRSTGACSVTSVKLDRDGRLLEASVRKTSGIPELDQIIIETIRRTSPYVNLPQGILDERGIYADSWGLCIGLRG